MAVDDDYHGELVHHFYAHLGDDFVTNPLSEHEFPLQSLVHRLGVDCDLGLADHCSWRARLHLPLRDSTDDHRRPVHWPRSSFIITIYMQSQVCSLYRFCTSNSYFLQIKFILFEIKFFYKIVFLSSQMKIKFIIKQFKQDIHKILI